MLGDLGIPGLVNRLLCASLFDLQHESIVQACHAYGALINLALYGDRERNSIVKDELAVLSIKRALASESAELNGRVSTAAPSLPLCWLRNAGSPAGHTGRPLSTPCASA